MATKRLDIVILGATGFTGQFAVREAARLSRSYNFTWGIAGRRQDALEAVLKKYAPNSVNIPIMIADLRDQESLKNMAISTKVIANCCGPYRFYGEVVIKACLAAKTHHVDVSGEPQFMERMQLEYNKAAQEAGIYIISACGFDSIPCDLGIVCTQKNFEGEINTIETYLNSWNTSNANGASLHYGTWESAIYGMAHSNELRQIRTKLLHKNLPTLEPRLSDRGIIHKSEISNGWSVIFPGTDRSIAKRTQRFMYEKYKQRPMQIQTYITFPSLFHVVLIAAFYGIFLILLKSEFGRNLLLKYPEIFSGGCASHEGPSEERMEDTHFSITFKATGWKEKLTELSDKHVDAPNKELITKVTGKNAGYGLTCTCLLLAGLTILRESDKMPDAGGVLTSGAAFLNTSLMEELKKNGMTFEIISSSEK
ncbi:saccharopine dehydrogenase-like oxidoreductase [Leptopilina heterotoma]|uniref:saccharopine dehydrogenase-like oxidoreductase n=1 Tax=Leptopilina heterotoma TaxID=63436 RepID=UPI001CA82AF8|nr:saccharopine dehydrogenase-like oxidoreductase [Leptopilina heterotoma]XP_043483927.1 saccharopine dehydrogenase-like oxidoreductase [Leptopilina heterotoma]XP_043483928.1 saccharopine dehydrogenase-like oxidoreductase [Leptopilina heterotoma]XP_043483929.1 saccharopine dehydrogenase-like oxidoreductase [Leptopilina heterotoma]